MLRKTKHQLEMRFLELENKLLQDIVTLRQDLYVTMLKVKGCENRIDKLEAVVDALLVEQDFLPYSAQPRQTNKPMPVTLKKAEEEPCHDEK